MLAAEIVEIYLQNGVVLVEGGSCAVICDAEIFDAAYCAFYFIYAVLYGIFVFAIAYVERGIADYLTAPVRAVDYRAADRIVPAEKVCGKLYFALFQQLFYSGGADFFVAVDYVFNGHIPDGIFFVVGVGLERGRLALFAVAEAEVFTAHIRF